MSKDRVATGMKIALAAFRVVFIAFYLSMTIYFAVFGEGAAFLMFVAPPLFVAIVDAVQYLLSRNLGAVRSFIAQAVLSAVKWLGTVAVTPVWALLIIVFALVGNGGMSSVFTVAMIVLALLAVVALVLEIVLEHRLKKNEEKEKTEEDTAAEQ